MAQHQAQQLTAASRKAACTPAMWRRHRFDLTATFAQLHRQGAACATQAAPGGGAAGEGGRRGGGAGCGGAE